MTWRDVSLEPARGGLAPEKAFGVEGVQNWRYLRLGWDEHALGNQ